MLKFAYASQSLCALSIRNGIISGLRASQALSPRSIDTLPENLLYYLPSISKIAAFLYGVAYLDSINRDENVTAIESTSEQTGAGTETESANKPKIKSDEEWQKVMESDETVVEIVEGNGEPPLIILHGTSASFIRAPSALFNKFLDCIRFSWDGGPLPLDAEVAHRDMGRADVRRRAHRHGRSARRLLPPKNQGPHPLPKTPPIHPPILTNSLPQAKQPHGPYRLASFSGSCALLLELITTFEQNGDTIAQFAMLDHFPTLFLARVDLAAVDLASAAWWDPVLHKSFKGILRLFETVQGVMAAQSKVRIQELQDALDGKPGTSAMTAKIIGRTTRLIRTTLAFLLGERFSVADEAGRRRFSPEVFRAYTRGIKAPLTIYVARGGIRAIIPQDKWVDFGAREYFPDAQFKEVDGGHIDFLGNEELLHYLKIDYESA